MMVSRRIQPYVREQPSAVQVRRYDAEGMLKEAGPDVAAAADRRALPPIVAQPLLQGRMSTRDHEKNAVRHSQLRAQRRSRRAESTSPTREGGADPQQPHLEQQPTPVARGKLTSGFRTDSQAAKRRTEVQDARNAMTWGARRRVAGGLSADGGAAGWQPAVSANYRHAGDLHSAELVSPDPKTALNQASPKRKKGGSKTRRKRAARASEEVGGNLNATQPWEDFKLPALGPQSGGGTGGAGPTALQPWAAQLAGDGWQGTGVDAEFSPWGALSTE